jgi:N-acetylglucosaminyl-diphospho-decaprenol L-rhamnosyltransferase
MGTSEVLVLVLNYNGRELLGQCLPSIVAAAKSSRHRCRLVVIDNSSSDDSCEYLAHHWPEIECIREPNRGLASFNHVLRRFQSPFAILLNNDVKLAIDSIDPLIDTLSRQPDALFSAPFCLGFDDATYEGMNTRVRDRYGLIQGVCRVPGYERAMLTPGFTASAGPVLAVDRLKFLALGGYDPIYFPGRIEDLDLGFRGWLCGWRGLYLPQSKAWHKGFGSFEPAFGANKCDLLALRNTLIFTWRNIRGTRLAMHFLWLLPRLVHSLMFRRGILLKALREAIGICRNNHERLAADLINLPDREYINRQESFFQQFSW